MSKSIFLIIFSLLSVISISQNRYCTFEEITGDKTYYYFYQYSTTKNGHIIQSVKTHNNDTIETQILTTDENYNSQKWEYIRESDNTHMAASLQGDKVIFKGRHDGDAINEEFELDGYKWIQIFPMNPGLNEYIKSGDEEVRFWVIGTAGGADMEINKFVAENDGKENLKILGENIDCWNLEMTLTGWRSYFWSASYFYSKNKLEVVKYDGSGSPGYSASITTIISEKID